MLVFVYENTCCHLENAEMTPELRDDLINLSFDNILDFFKIAYLDLLRIFIVRFFNCLKSLVSIPSFSLMRSPCIYAFRDTAIIQRKSHLPHFSSWLRQDAL
jgi:hypothetical protein